MRLSKALIQLYEMQELIVKATKDPNISYPDLAKLSLAWERLEERKRVLRRVPLPGSLRPDANQTKKKRGSISATEASSPTDVWVELPPQQPSPEQPPDAQAQA